MSPRGKPAAPGLREQGRQERRRRVLAAARKLFAEQGFAATTIEQIARTAKVAKGTIFLHAANKHELLFLVFETAISATYEDAFASLPEGPLVDRLMYVFGRFFDFYAGHPPLSKVMIREVAALEGEQRQANEQLNQRFFGRLVELLGAAQATGEVRRGIDLLAAVSLIFGAYGMVVLRWIDEPGPDPEAAKVRLRGLFEVLMTGLGPDGPKA